MRNNPADHGRYEHSDVHARPLIIVAAVLVIATLVSAAIGYWMMRTIFVEGDEMPHVRADERVRWDTPVRVQPSPPADFLRYRDLQETITTSYATISSEPEIYSIPVETAMEVVAKNGFPEFRSLVPEGTEALMDATRAAGSEDASGPSSQAPQNTQEQ